MNDEIEQKTITLCPEATQEILIDLFTQQNDIMAKALGYRNVDDMAGQGFWPQHDPVRHVIIARRFST